MMQLRVPANNLNWKQNENQVFWLDFHAKMTLF